MISEKICLKIKFERQKRKMSQEELAFKSGLNRNTIWKIEAGLVSPTIASVEKIANALDIDFATLMDISKVEL